ncbi:WbqC family protein [Pseudomonas sp. LS1212]|uniref:WbqC family protein n=1 Tax=Pseudomonas sp. LS1212 TaxID=2972478 RepID=UPI00215BBBAA|nr:WbqC family protein [Pseudomonas sp. LS1212]UVJ45419.1 WbqC family protein [Pseudomonas sp. LS1212]
MPAVQPVSKRIVLMQPYFLPYLGYFQLMAAADCFVIYDNVQFIKNGWIERNRYLLDGEAKWFGVPLGKSSHTRLILERQVSPLFDLDALLNRLDFAYRKAPRQRLMLDWLKALLSPAAANIAELNERLLRACCDLLGLQVPILRASELIENSRFSGEARVIEMVQALGGTHYLNPMGGKALYQQEHFGREGLMLEFLRPYLPAYPQGGRDFLPGLSILDALMFNEPAVVADWARQGVVERG